MGRIVARNWIIDLGRDPAAVWHPDYDKVTDYNDEIIAAVRWAIDRLDPGEAEFVRMYYFQGMSYQLIGTLTGNEPRSLMKIHRSAKRKLRQRLCRILAGRYNVPVRLEPACPLCDHARAEEIDALIRSKSQRETWRTTIEVLKRSYAIRNITPQILLTHREYHML